MADRNDDKIKLFDEWDDEKTKAFNKEQQQALEAFKQRKLRILNLVRLLFVSNPPSDDNENIRRVLLFIDCLSVAENWKIEPTGTYEMYSEINNALEYCQRILELSCLTEQIRKADTEDMMEFFRLQTVERALANALFLIGTRLKELEEAEKQQKGSTGILNRLAEVFRK